MIKSIKDVLSGMQVARPMPTGVKFLDENLGGLYPGEVTVVCGYDNDGKTALMIRMIHRLCFDNNIPVLVVLVGMEEQTFLSCMAAYHCGIICDDIHKVSMDDDNTKTFWQLLREKPFYMASKEDLKVEKIEDFKREIKNQGIKAVFVEKASALELYRRGRSFIGLFLKGLAKELKVTMVVEQELWNSLWEGCSSISLTQIEETDLGHYADNVIGIVDYNNHGGYDEQARDMRGLVKVIIMKHKGLVSLKKDAFLRKITLYCHDWRRAMEYETEHIFESNPHIQSLFRKFDCELADEECL